MIKEKKTQSLERDTAEVVKNFLNREMMEIDEPELFQGPLNFDSLWFKQ